MTRNFTANRPRLNLRERVRVEDNYLYVGPLKVAEFVPATLTLRFATRRRDTPAGAPRMVEVDLGEFVNVLARAVENEVVH